MSRANASRPLFNPNEGEAPDTGDKRDRPCDMDEELEDRQRCYGAAWAKARRLAGPRKEQEDEKRPLTQPRRRLVRHLMEEAIKVHEKGLQGLKLDEAKIAIMKEALTAGEMTVTEADEGATRNVPRSAHEQIEEKAMRKLGGTEEVLKMIMEEDKLEGLMEEFRNSEHDLTQRLHLKEYEEIDKAGRKVIKNRLRIWTTDPAETDKTIAEVMEEAEVDIEDGNEEGAFVTALETEAIEAMTQFMDSAECNANHKEVSTTDGKEKQQEEWENKGLTRDVRMIVTREDLDAERTRCKMEIEEDSDIDSDGDEDEVNTMTKESECKATQHCRPILVDQFAGVGVGAQGFREQGFDIGTVCEKGDAQVRALQQRYKDSDGARRVIRDIRSMKKQHLQGAFTTLSSSPCPAFSKSGHKGGWLDRRSYYFDSQCKAAIEAEVATIIVENVEEVTRSMQGHEKHGTISPLEALIKQLEPKYITEWRIMDSGKMKGFTRRPRAILQAKLKTLAADASQERGKIEARLKEAWEKMCKNEGMNATQGGWKDHFDISEAGFVWATEGKITEEQHANKIMERWEDVPDEYKLAKRRWHEFDQRDDARSGAHRVGIRWSENNDIGKIHDPNRLLSSKGLVAGLTAFGNSGWYLTRTSAGKMGIRRLTGEEFLKTMGVTGKHELEPGSFSERDMCEMAGNAITAHLSQRLAVAARSYYDSAWHTKHVQDIWKREERTWDETALEEDIRAWKQGSTDEEWDMGNEDMDTDISEGEDLQHAWQRTNKEGIRVHKRLKHLDDLWSQHRMTSLTKQYSPSATEATAAKVSTSLRGGTGSVQHKVEVHRLKRGAEARVVTEESPEETRRDVGEILRTGEKGAWRELRERQREDIEFKVIAEFAETGKLPSNPLERHYLHQKEEYLTKEGILYRVNREGKGAEAEYKLQLVVPRSMQFEIAKRYHEKLGHIKSRSLCATLQEKYWWPCILRDCITVVAACEKCERYADLTPSTGRMSYTETTEERSRPGDAIYMDILGPYSSSATEQGYRYLLAIEDDFTRYIALFPMKVIDSENVADRIEQYASQFGWPLHVKSDRASNFIGGAMNCLYKRWGVRKSHSAAIHPEGHSRIERVNRHIQKSMRTTLDGNPEWCREAHAMAQAWNCTAKRMLGHVSPFYLMFGRAPRFGFDEPNPDINDKFSTVEWVKDKIGSLKRRWQLVSDGLAGYKLEILYQARQRWKEKPAIEIQPGAQVRIHLPVVSGKGTASKLAARWSEAYTVIGRAMGGKALNTYIVKKLHNSKATSVPIHVSRIRVMATKGETMPRITMTGEMEMAGEIAEETSDAILGMTEPTGEENATRRKRIEGLLRFRARGDKEPLLSSEAEATDMLERWSRELERRPGENEEVTLAPQELVDIYSGRGAPHTTTPTTGSTGNTEKRNDADERDALDEGIAEGVRRQTGHNRQGDQGRGSDATSAKAADKAKKRQRKKDDSTFPFKAVTRIQTIDKIARKWGMKARELIDLNKPFMVRGNDKEFPLTASDRIRNGTKLRVPERMQEGKITAEKLGDKGMIWTIKETPYYVDRQEVTTEGVAVTQRHYLVVWDDAMLEQNDELWSWVEAGELEVADRVIQQAEGESSREAAETKLKERMGITEEKEREVNQLTGSRRSSSRLPDTDKIAAMHRASDGTTKHILMRHSRTSNRGEGMQPKEKKWYEWQSKSAAGEARWKRAEAEFPITRRATTGDTVEWKEHNQRSKAEVSAIQTMSDFRGEITPSAGWTEVARVVTNKKGEVRWLITPQDSTEQQQEGEAEGTGEEESEAKRFERITKQGKMKASQDESVTERLETLAETKKPVTQVLDLQNISSTMSKTQIMWARAAIIRQGIKVIILGGAKSVKQGLWDMLKEVTTQTKIVEVRSRSDQDDEGRSKSKGARALEEIVSRNNRGTEEADIPEEERHLWEARKTQTRKDTAKLAKEFKENWTSCGERGQEVRHRAIDVISNTCNVRKGNSTGTAGSKGTIQHAGERVRRILEIISGDNPSGDAKQSKAQRQGFLEPEATELAIQQIKEYRGEEKADKDNQRPPTEEESKAEEEQVTSINILLWKWPMTGPPQVAITETGEIPNRQLMLADQAQRGGKDGTKKVISKARKMARGIIAEKSGALARDLAEMMYEDMHGNMAQDDVRKGSTQKHGNEMTQSWTVASTAAAAQIAEEGRMTWINAEDAPISEQTIREAMRRKEQAKARVITANTAKSHEGAAIVTRRPDCEGKGCGLTAAITVPQGTIIGNLMWGTNRITEQEKRKAQIDQTWDERRVFHRYRRQEGEEENRGTQEEDEDKQPRERSGTKVYYTPTSRSSPAWFINHSKEQPNCKIEENGNIRTQRTVWRGESLEADYSKLSGGRKHKQLRAGDAGDDARGAHQDTEARQALCEWNPAEGDIKEAWRLMKRVLSEHEATTGEVTGIGHMDATGSAPDLFSVLTALKATKLSDQDKQWTKAVEGDNDKRRANIPQLARTGEDIRELILTTFEAATNNPQERKKILEEEERAADDPDSYLYTAEVTSLDAAQQYLAVFHQRFGTNKAKVFEKDETIYRFHKALTFVTEKAERNKNQETPVAGIEVHFPVDFSTIREFEAFVTPRQIKTMGIRIVDKPEVKVIMQDEGGNRISRMGMVVKMMGKDANRRTLIVATRWTDDMSHNKTVEMVPMVRSPTGQRIRMALDTIYEEEAEETEEEKERRTGPDRKLRAGTKRRMNAAFESIRSILRGDNPEARKGAETRERAYEAVDEWENQLMRKLTEGQASAVKMAYRNKISVIQGPPGTGKSTVLRHIIQRVAWYNKKQGQGGQTLVTSGGNKVVQDWVRALGMYKHPDGTPLQIAWHVSASYAHRVPDDLKKYTVEEMALYQPEGYTEPMENRASHARLAQLHRLEKEGKASPEESKLYEGLMKKAQEGVIKTAQVLLMTASQCGVKKITTRKFETVAVDEASQITELAMFPVLGLQTESIVLVGDHKQLAPRQDLPLAQQMKLDSLFQRLREKELKDSSLMLTDVFRMSEQAGRWHNEAIYEGKLENWHNTEARNAKMRETNIMRDPHIPVAIVEVNDGVENTPPNSFSKRNSAEVSMAVKVAKRVIKEARGVFTASSIAVIALYAAQEEELKATFAEHKELQGVVIGTVDSWQGSERDIVIVCTTRTREKPAGFIICERRMNVMASRHKHGLIVLAHKNMQTAGPKWTTLIAHLRTGGLSWEGEENDEGNSNNVATATIACISTPCDFCADDKAKTIFRAPKHKQVSIKWDGEKGYKLEATTRIRANTEVEEIGDDDWNKDLEIMRDHKQQRGAWYPLVTAGDERQRSAILAMNEPSIGEGPTCEMRRTKRGVKIITRTQVEAGEELTMAYGEDARNNREYGTERSGRPRLEIKEAPNRSRTTPRELAHREPTERDETNLKRARAQLKNSIEKNERTQGGLGRGLRRRKWIGGVRWRVGETGLTEECTKRNPEHQTLPTCDTAADVIAMLEMATESIEIRGIVIRAKKGITASAWEQNTITRLIIEVAGSEQLLALNVDGLQDLNLPWEEIETQIATRAHGLVAFTARGGSITQALQDKLRTNRDSTEQWLKVKWIKNLNLGMEFRPERTKRYKAFQQDQETKTRTEKIEEEEAKDDPGDEEVEGRDERKWSDLEEGAAEKRRLRKEGREADMQQREMRAAAGDRLQRLHDMKPHFRRSPEWITTLSGEIDAPERWRRLVQRNLHWDSWKVGMIGFNEEHNARKQLEENRSILPTVDVMRMAATMLIALEFQHVLRDHAVTHLNHAKPTGADNQRRNGKGQYIRRDVTWSAWNERADNKEEEPTHERERQTREISSEQKRAEDVVGIMLEYTHRHGGSTKSWRNLTRRVMSANKGLGDERFFVLNGFINGSKRPVKRYNISGAAKRSKEIIYQVERVIGVTNQWETAKFCLREFMTGENRMGDNERNAHEMRLHRYRNEAQQEMEILRQQWAWHTIRRLVERMSIGGASCEEVTEERKDLMEVWETAHYDMDFETGDANWYEAKSTSTNPEKKKYLGEGTQWRRLEHNMQTQKGNETGQEGSLLMAWKEVTYPHRTRLKEKFMTKLERSRTRNEDKVKHGEAKSYGGVLCEMLGSIGSRRRREKIREAKNDPCTLEEVNNRAREISDKGADFTVARTGIRTNSPTTGGALEVGMPAKGSGMIHDTDGHGQRALYKRTLGRPFPGKPKKDLLDGDGDEEGDEDEERQDKQQEIITSINTRPSDKESLRILSWRTLASKPIWRLTRADETGGRHREGKEREETTTAQNSVRKSEDILNMLSQEERDEVREGMTALENRLKRDENHMREGMAPEVREAVAAWMSREEGRINELRRYETVQETKEIAAKGIIGEGSFSIGPHVEIPGGIEARITTGADKRASPTQLMQVSPYKFTEQWWQSATVNDIWTAEGEGDVQEGTTWIGMMWLQRDQIEPTGAEWEERVADIADGCQTKKEYEEAKEKNEYKLEDKFLSSCHLYVPREGIVIQRYRTADREDKQTALTGRIIKLQPGHSWTATQLLEDWSETANEYEQQRREGRRARRAAEAEEITTMEGTETTKKEGTEENGVGLEREVTATDRGDEDETNQGRADTQELVSGKTTAEKNKDETEEKERSRAGEGSSEKKDAAEIGWWMRVSTGARQDTEDIKDYSSLIQRIIKREMNNKEGNEGTTNNKRYERLVEINRQKKGSSEYMKDLEHEDEELKKALGEIITIGVESSPNNHRSDLVKGEQPLSRNKERKVLRTYIKGGQEGSVL